MSISPFDGCCRNCGGPLEAIEAAGGLKTVVCLDCGASSVIDIDTERITEPSVDGGDP